jgi:hypothetical protein
LVSAGIPILVLKAPSLARKVGQFDYFKYIQQLSNSNKRIIFKNVSNTDHSFAEGAGKEAVRKETESFLEGCCTLPKEAARKWRGRQAVSSN